MQIETFQIREMREIIYQVLKVIMGKIQPLQGMAVLHYVWNDLAQTLKRSKFVVAEHERATYQFDADYLN
jgi:hypothetical protein